VLQISDRMGAGFRTLAPAFAPALMRLACAGDESLAAAAAAALDGMLRHARTAAELLPVIAAAATDARRPALRRRAFAMLVETLQRLQQPAVAARAADAVERAVRLGVSDADDGARAVATRCFMVLADGWHQRAKQCVAPSSAPLVGADACGRRVLERQPVALQRHLQAQLDERASQRLAAMRASHRVGSTPASAPVSPGMAPADSDELEWFAAVNESGACRQGKAGRV
jgi:hypothetical protein